jgi:hypothetical protein
VVRRDSGSEGLVRSLPGVFLPADAAPGPALHATLPAGPVPVPAVCGPGVKARPGDHMRHTGLDFLVTSRAAVGLGRGRAGYQADHPVPVRP